MNEKHVIMMTSSNGNIFRVTGHLCGEFTGPGWVPRTWPVTRSFDVFFDLRLNKRLSKQSWGWWLETLSRPLWRHRNGWRTYAHPDTKMSTVLLYHISRHYRVINGSQVPMQHQVSTNNRSNHHSFTAIARAWEWQVLLNTGFVAEGKSVACKSC